MESMAGALREASLGNLAEARNAAAVIQDASKLADNTEQMAALAYAWIGDAARTQNLLSALEKEYPQGTLVNFVILPTAQARLELSKGHAQKSIQLLQSASVYELSEGPFAS
jgi:hypothetical protein